MGTLPNGAWTSCPQEILEDIHSGIWDQYQQEHKVDCTCMICRVDTIKRTTSYQETNAERLYRLSTNSR